MEDRMSSDRRRRRGDREILKGQMSPNEMVFVCINNLKADAVSHVNLSGCHYYFAVAAAM
jgi:hypothetical protein